MVRSSRGTRLAVAALLAGSSLYATHAFAQGSPDHSAHQQHAAQPATSTTNATGAEATLVNAEGQPLGTVKLSKQGDTLFGVIGVTGLAAGERGMHIHMVGKCEGPDFASAGGHLNPDNKSHGLLEANGAHQGDLPNLIVRPDGTGQAVFVARTNLASLFDADSASFIIHATGDDYRTDPSGNSGARILCGVLKPTSG